MGILKKGVRPGKYAFELKLCCAVWYDEKNSSDLERDEDMPERDRIIDSPDMAAGENALLIETAAGRTPAELVLKNAQYVNVFSGELLRGDIAVCNGKIAGIGTYGGKEEIDMGKKILCPGFIDAHIHLESSLVSPSEFARIVLSHGTTAVVTDPHEIANVMGEQGIDYMLQATEGLPLDVFFAVPSCVPASEFDEPGAFLDHGTVEKYMENPRVIGLAEMMDYPGVTGADPDVLAKIAVARAFCRRIDGHAPGLTGNELNAYTAAGIRSDHECSTLEEALEKLRRGQYIMIREGTAARNLKALHPLLSMPCYTRCMFCTDDKHPSDLLEKGHMDYICRQAVRMGAAPIRAVQAATLHAAQYFGLDGRGAIAPGYFADFAVVEDLQSFHVSAVYKKGELVWEEGKETAFPAPAVDQDLQKAAENTFRLPKLRLESVYLSHGGVIGMIPGEITTENRGFADRTDLEKDIVKIAVAERHSDTGHIGLGYLQGYGLRRGAVATSVAHDSHNIIAVGANDEDLVYAVNRVAENRGGIVVACGGEMVAELVLETAGLMSRAPLAEVNRTLEEAKQAAHRLGVHKGIDPFMTLSFMSLPVIPELRITTHGVVDVAKRRLL